MAVYFIMNDTTHDVKIGTSTDPVDRLRSLQTACSDRLVLLGTVRGGFVEEKAIHGRFARFRKGGGEWFVGDPMLLLGIGKVIGSDSIAGEDLVVVSGRKRGRGDRAVEWLTARFRERREWAGVDLKMAAERDGISKNALCSYPVAQLPILKRPTEDLDGNRRWIWVAVPGWPDMPAEVLCP